MYEVCWVCLLVMHLLIEPNGKGSRRSFKRGKHYCCVTESHRCNYFWAQHDAGLAYLGVPGYLKSRRSTAMLPLLAEQRKAGREFQSGRSDGSVDAPAKSDSKGRCNWLLVTAL